MIFMQFSHSQNHCAACAGKEARPMADEQRFDSAAPEEPEHLAPQLMEEEKPHYTPRPRWQVIFAWVLFGIVVLGIINICYWQITG